MNEEKNALRAHTKMHYILQTFRRGLLRLVRRPVLAVIWLALAALLVGLICSPWLLGLAQGVAIISAVAHTVCCSCCCFCLFLVTTRRLGGFIMI